MSGVVRYISPQAEFTPPVIYSEQTQAKLVFMAEAWADANPERLHPGQPVLVRLVEGEK
jgi:HlyD family secretion protein